MSTLSKSPLRVARRALAVATGALRPYAHKFSPKLYTQPQLFVCLVLKTFFKTDYRGLTTLLRDFTDLREHKGDAARFGREPAAPPPRYFFRRDLRGPEGRPAASWSRY